jgi:hypothetical protein
MAEIHVESKNHQSTPAWVWILVSLAVIGLLAYFLTRNNTNTNENTGTNPNNTTSYVEPVSVDGFYLAA